MGKNGRIVSDGKADERDSLVAGVLLGASQDLTGSVLVVEEYTGEVLRGLKENGCNASAWQRMCTDKILGTPWPEGGPFDVALIRQPKSKEAFEMALHAALSVLKEGGEVRVCGANDEGAKSANKIMETVLDNVFSLDTRRHCRVWSGVKNPSRALKAPLIAWKSEVETPVPGRTWITYPGVFAKGGLDDGTRLLLGAMPNLNARKVLDFAAGGGVISGHVMDRYPDANLWMLEADAIALEAAKENVPGATPILSDAWNSVPKIRVDRILSNPPIHRGKSEDYRVLRSLIELAPQVLTPMGELWIVVQRQVPAQKLFEKGWTVSLAAEDTRFRVWRAIVKEK